MVERRFALLDAARPALLQVFGDVGVQQIHYVAAFPNLNDFGVWLATAPDVEADTLRSDPELRHGGVVAGSPATGNAHQCWVLSHWSW